MSATKLLLPVKISSDLVFAVGIAFILGMLIIPMPSAILDVMLAANMGFAALILVSVMLSDRPLAMSTFPTILLVTTLFRLALNVSTTRMILSTGRAGEVVSAFGDFVLRGDVIVGLVVFVVLTLVQMMVIAKGAERVAEVGARFTLDAMPGKQMSIDADLRNGAIDDETARRLRSDLGRESQFYGSMDGAMKFVKGDAIAGLVITAINLVAGLAIGVVRFDMGIGEAATVYSTLTVGDGLVSQIPSLLISLASGMLTTRVADTEKQEGLAASLELELLSAPKALAIGGGFCCALGLIPGLPTVPFMVIAAGMGGLAYLRRTPEEHTKGGAAAAAGQSEEVKARVEQAKQQRSVLDQMAPSVSLLTVELSRKLSEAFGFGQKSDDQTELLGELIPQLRDAVFLDTGVRIPGARIRTHVNALPEHGFRILLKEVAIFQGEVPPEAVFVLASPKRLRRTGNFKTAEVPHPSSGTACSFAPADRGPALKKLGMQVWSPQGYIALHVLARVKENLPEFLGVQEVADMLEQMKKVYPVLVEETVPKVVSLSTLVDILRHLVREKISIRDFRSILDSISAHGETAPDPFTLVEWVRAALRLQIVNQVAGGQSKLGVIVVRPEVEMFIEESVVRSAGGLHLAMEPEMRLQLLQSIANAIEPAIKAATKPVLLTRNEIRGHLSRLLEAHFPFAQVLAHDDIPNTIELHPVAALELAA